MAVMDGPGLRSLIFSCLAAFCGAPRWGKFTPFLEHPRVAVAVVLNWRQCCSQGGHWAMREAFLAVTAGEETDAGI